MIFISLSDSIAALVISNSRFTFKTAQSTTKAMLRDTPKNPSPRKALHINTGTRSL